MAPKAVIVEDEEDIVVFPSCGVQHDSIKRSNAQWSMGKAGRENQKKVFISNKHCQDMVGKDGPGFRYNTAGEIKGGYSFGTSPQRPKPQGAQYPDASADRIGNMPNALKFKYPQRSASIGNCPRGAACSAPDLKGFVTGAVSPGPQRYNTANAPMVVKHAHAPGIDRNAPKYSIRQRTNMKENGAPATGTKVGPGLYPPAEACTEQAESTKPTLPKWGINKCDRFPNKRQHDSYRIWDGEGEKKIQFNRMYNSTPSFSFGTSTRAHAKKVQQNFTPLDKGPVASMPASTQHHPHLAPRHEMIKYSDVHAG